MRAYERFLKYICTDTTSNDASKRVPSSECQLTLGRDLANELRNLGINNAYCDEKCYVYASIPATAGMEEVPAVGFIAHIDTVEDFLGQNIKPQLTKNYNGKDIELGCGRALCVSDFPHLESLKGRTLITSAGDTILGADDKAGVAEIMTLAENLVNSDVPHGKICIGFTPDEEIGRGADHFDVERFGANFAYTVDGGVEGEVVYENFNAASASFEIKGFNIHPGGAKNKMINAALVACEINSMLPSGDTPRNTEGYEGFYHLCNMKGQVSDAELYYIVRDHNSESFEARCKYLRHIEKLINEKYGAETVKLTLKEQYRNMIECITPCMEIVDAAKQACLSVGVEPVISPIRGGTDGARLSFMGLPCPNLGTAGYACHGPYEHITVEGMDKVVDILMAIVAHFVKSAK